VSLELVPLAIVMWAVTYPSRAVGLLAPSLDRLPRRVLEYLQLVGPAVLGALAAVNTVTLVRDSGLVPLAAVVACVALVAWRRNLFLGLTVAVTVAIAGRAVGWS
jgi:branched-subunit amino acid transport protein